MKQFKIVVTGGPSGGKTTLIEAMKKELGQSVAVVPEAASILYRGGFPRRKTHHSIVHTQRAIYHTQKELEELISGENKKAKLIVCDRGSLDGMAYWPLGSRHFFSNIHSNLQREISRYHWVIHLDTASTSYYDVSNPVRIETHTEAVRLNDRVKRAWKRHPRRFIISQNEDFVSKMTLSLAVIKSILAGKKYSEIQELIFSLRDGN